MARTDATFKNQEETMQNNATSIKNLEMQIGQIANMLNFRQLGTLPSDTERT